MQSLEASKHYKNSFVCAARIFKDEGILTFWSGAMPRLARLILSGGIVFTMCVETFPSCWNIWHSFCLANSKQVREVDGVDGPGRPRAQVYLEMGHSQQLPTYEGNPFVVNLNGPGADVNKTKRP